MSKTTKLELNVDRQGESPATGAPILWRTLQVVPCEDSCVANDDIFDNRLIFGDNLLALKALEQEYAGKIKCFY